MQLWVFGSLTEMRWYHSHLHQRPHLSARVCHLLKIDASLLKSQHSCQWKCQVSSKWKALTVLFMNEAVRRLCYDSSKSASPCKKSQILVTLAENPQHSATDYLRRHLKSTECLQSTVREMNIRHWMCHFYCIFTAYVPRGSNLVTAFCRCKIYMYLKQT